MWDEAQQARDFRPAISRLMPPGRALSLLGLLLVSLGLAGCRNQNQQVLENELRARDFQNRDLLDELKKSEFHNQSLQQEIQAIRAGTKITPEQAAQNFGLKRIVLGKLTMGVNRGKCAGDDALQVIVEPQDVDGHTIKVPGTVQVIAHEISAQGVKLPLSTWDLSEDKVRQSWKQGLFATGYYFTLPWQTWPQHENLRVTIHFVLSDSRVFEADRDVKVRLLPRDLLPTPTPTPTPNEPAVIRESKWSPFREDMRATPRPTPPGNWQPAPLGEVVELGRPELLE